MNLEEFANHLLRSPSLKDKLFFPEKFDDAPSSLEYVLPPPKPIRSRELIKGSDQKIHFDRLRQLESESVRGRILHFFANHELLAIEIMALALVRFPEAPRTFRLGVANTIRDEQTHFGLYAHRMRDFGIEFGDFELSTYFWDACKDMKSPFDFVSWMGLTFEQANLDYATYFYQKFMEVGDHDTAKILKIVYEDEISHVRFGNNWFSKWSSTKCAEWPIYQKSLVPPLTPRRARGIGFDREGRLRAGISEDFMAELEVYSSSRSRPGRLYFFNPLAEQEIGHPCRGFTPGLSLKTFAQDFEMNLLVLTGEEDALIVRERPRKEFLKSLCEIGFSIPSFALKDSLKDDLNSQGNLKYSDFSPWGWSQEAFKMQTEAQKNLVMVREDRTSNGNTLINGIYSKVWSTSLRKEFCQKMNDRFSRFLNVSAESFIVTSPDEIGPVGQALSRQGFKIAVAKACFGSSGHNMKKFYLESSESNIVAWIAKQIKLSGALVIEPWLDKVAEFGVQIYVSETGTKFLGFSRYTTSLTGQLTSHIIGDRLFGLSPNLRQYLFTHSQEVCDFFALMREVAVFVGHQLSARGYRGFAGIDQFIFRSGETLAINPIVEINSRVTVGTLALKLQKKLAHPQKASFFRVIRRNELEGLGFPSFKDFGRACRRDFPVRTTESSGVQKLQSGVVFLTDSETAREGVSILDLDGRFSQHLATKGYSTLN